MLVAFLMIFTTRVNSYIGTTIVVPDCVDVTYTIFTNTVAPYLINSKYIVNPNYYAVK